MGEPFFFYTLLTKRAVLSCFGQRPTSALPFDLGVDDYPLVQPYSFVADWTRFETLAPLSIDENTVFSAQAVAGNEATGFELHDAHYVPYETLDDPVGHDEFTYDTDWTSLVLNNSHDEANIAVVPETVEIVNNLSKANLPNDTDSFRYVHQSACHWLGGS